MRLPDFLRSAVLLFSSSATLLAAVTLVGARGDDDPGVVYFALGWWTLAALGGLLLARGSATTTGMTRLLASARGVSALPEVEPARVIVNRLWALAVFTLLGGGLAFLAPQVPAIGAGYALAVTLAWRKQEGAVKAIEDRDGVRFYLERGSPFGATRLVRTPGLRKVDAPPAQAARASGVARGYGASAMPTKRS